MKEWYLDVFMQEVAEMFVILTKNRPNCSSHYNIVEDEPNIIIETRFQKKVKLRRGNHDGHILDVLGRIVFNVASTPSADKFNLRWKEEELLQSDIQLLYYVSSQ
jgi:hypothetical protein